MSSENDRVLAVGAGPVGLTAALALRRRGIETLVLASGQALVMELRGTTFHPPTLDLFDEFALVPRIIEVGLKAPTWQFRDRETGPVATFDLALLAGDQPPLPGAMRAVEADAVSRREAAQRGCRVPLRA